MFVCTICQTKFSILNKAFQHAKTHVIKSLNIIEYLPPSELLGEYEFTQTITKRIMTSGVSLSGRLKKNSFGLPEKTPTFGGKHKSFDAEKALVYAKTPSAMTDFIKETDMKENLDRLELQDGSKIRDIFFSFQNNLENTDESIKDAVARYRRVSIYIPNNSLHNQIPEQNPNDPSLNGYFQILCEDIKTAKIIENRYEIIRKLVVQMIHQLVYIHYCMYNAQIQHGDLHMGNIKLIIDNQGFPVIKVFDFGKSKLVNSISNQMKDLEYFFCRQAVSGILETFKRNKLRNDKSTEQLKHYPLHRLSSLLLRNKGMNENELFNYIDTSGREMIEILKSIQKSPPKHQSLRMLFQSFSNNIVKIFYE